jgi:hypothetical protein
MARSRSQHISTGVFRARSRFRATIMALFRLSSRFARSVLNCLRASSCSYSSASSHHASEDALYSQGAALTVWQGVVAAVLGADKGRGLIARHSFEPGDLVMCVQPAAVVQGETDEQPDPEFLVPELLAAARQPKVLAALSHLYDGTGKDGCHTHTSTNTCVGWCYSLPHTMDFPASLGCCHLSVQMPPNSSCQPCL